ncbi:TPA: acetate--CoA ligase [Candidatus Woesearchaeota archaeon]|nr:acetate--CoA ligase [Candidatus Woesearchaeota archaeon]
MEDKVIRKDVSALKVSPNLKDYAQTYGSFSQEDYDKEIAFFADGKLNAAYNAVDRHVEAGLKDKTAFVWVGDDGEKKFTYGDLSRLSNRFANVLKKIGVKKGDRVFLFLPRIPELYISFLGTMKTGAIAGTLFAAFGPEAILDRVGHAEAVVLVTSPDLKPRVDQIRGRMPALKTVIVTGDDHPGDGELNFDVEMGSVSDEFEIAHMERKDRAYMLYTSGTTGKPKGVIHTHYDVAHQHLTAKWILDLHQDDVYWCTADPGWVTGIAYGILGPWSNGVTSIVDARRFSAEKWYKLINDYRVTVWYTAPTAIRLMMKEGHELAKKYDLSSLRFLASVGEPLNPEAVWWSLEHIGLPFHDNFWQTETGGILIANYASMDIKPGSMGKPFPGIKAGIVDAEGNEKPVGKAGDLCIRPGWPSMMVEIWKNPDKYNEYFRDGWYVTGDKARMDEDGYFWFIGRADDVINTAGHRVGPFEVESALIEHPAIAEAGVIGKPDEMYGEIIKAFVTLNKGHQMTPELMEDVKKFIKTRLAGHAYPKEIEVRDSLPKTRSGKIMRRVLKAQEMGQPIGDTSTMEDD